MIGVNTAGPLGGMTVDQAPSPLPVDRRTWRELDLGRIDPLVDRPYWIALSQLPGLGPVGFARLLHRYGSAAGAWAAGAELLTALSRLPTGTELVLRRLQHEGAPAVADRLQDATRHCGGQILTALDAAYPATLARLEARPPVLHVRGDLTALDAPCVAIVGTRQASGYGRACAVDIADELARAGVTVISGLALGIDGEAHAATIAARGRSVAVLPSPLDGIYPPRHRGLAERLVATGGALVTELAPGQSPGRPDFARRNRIIAGLAMAVVVVEAPDRSGALLTASAAIAYEKELYAVPGPMDAVRSRGCNRLIADQQASMVTSAAALLQHIGARRGDRPIAVASLSEAEGRVLNALLSRSGSIEELMDRTRLATGSLASALTLLEARGLATSYGGATFHATLAARRIGRGS
jgi:DNA processing protein